MGDKIDDGVRYQAKDAAEDLINRLQSLPALTALTANPLLLTMIATIHRYRGELPKRRVELYVEMCDILLGHLPASKERPIKLTALQKRAVLQPLAAQMIQNKIRDIPQSDAIQIIIPPLKRVGVVDKSAEDFLSDIQASSGLLLEREVDVWRFAHLTFQEYLAATHFLEQKINLYWYELVNDSWWYDTLRLYAAQGNATRLVQACLDKSNEMTLTLSPGFTWGYSNSTPTGLKK